MPMRSQAQRAAMHAAASGNSTIGIPKSVGQEFVASDTGEKLPATSKDKSAKRHKPGKQVDYNQLVRTAAGYAK